MSKSFSVVTWNMDYWRRRSTESQARAWRTLDDEVGANVSLLQEARAPDSRRVVHGRRGSTGDKAGPL